MQVASSCDDLVYSVFNVEIWQRCRLEFLVVGVLEMICQALDVVMETVQADFLISWYKFFGNDISHITCVNWSGAG